MNTLKEVYNLICFINNEVFTGNEYQDSVFDCFSGEWLYEPTPEKIEFTNRKERRIKALCSYAVASGFTETTDWYMWEVEND